MNLALLREKIHAIDVKIVTLVAERQSYMPAVGAHKKKLGLPITQKAREEQVLNEVMQLADAKNVSKDLIKAVFKLLFNDAKRIQRAGLLRK